MQVNRKIDDPTPAPNFRSFGHFQAHEYGTANGFSDNPSRGRIGFAKTRLSVTKVKLKHSDCQKLK